MSNAVTHFAADCIAPRDWKGKIVRCIIASLLLWLGALSTAAVAQSPSPYLRVIASHLEVESFAQLDWQTQCPAGYIPLSYSIIRGHTYDEDQLLALDMIDSSGNRVSPDSLTSAAAILGGGFTVSDLNTEHHLKDFGITALCLSTAASSDNTLALIPASGTAAAGAIGTANSFCNADYPVALAGFSSADNVLLQQVGSSPIWGTSASPLPLSSLPDGQTGPPAGWQVKVFNSTSTTAAITSFSVCGKAPSLQTFVYSAPLAIAFTAAFSVYGAVPDGWTAVGLGIDTGSFAFGMQADAWVEDGTVADAIQWYPNSTYYDSGPMPVRGFMMRSAAVTFKMGTSPPPRAILAVMALPQPAHAAADQRRRHRVLQREPRSLLHHADSPGDQRPRHRCSRGLGPHRPKLQCLRGRQQWPHHAPPGMS